MPPLSETFAGAVGRWRVVDKGNEPGRDARTRFAVMAVPLGAPVPTGIDDPLVEFELCAVQYRPHAEAIAALPELARLVELSDDKETRRSQEWFSALSKARAKAEGRA